MGEFISDGYYADGGIIGVNKSAQAGTWAWAKIVDGQMVASASGIVVAHGYPYPDEVAGYVFEEPTSIAFIGNNFTELLAAVEALEHSVLMKWTIAKLHSDNLNAIGRLTMGWACNGVPDWLLDRMKQVQSRLHIEAQLLSGHPNKKQLQSGIGPRGYPCSKFNVWCDSECKRLSKLFRENL